MRVKISDDQTAVIDLLRSKVTGNHQLFHQVFLNLVNALPTREECNGASKAVAMGNLMTKSDTNKQSSGATA